MLVAQGYQGDEENVGNEPWLSKAQGYSFKILTVIKINLERCIDFLRREPICCLLETYVIDCSIDPSALSPLSSHAAKNEPFTPRSYKKKGSCLKSSM